MLAKVYKTYEEKETNEGQRQQDRRADRKIAKHCCRARLYVYHRFLRFSDNVVYGLLCGNLTPK